MGAVGYCENLILDNYGDWSLYQKISQKKRRAKFKSNPFISKFHNIQDSQLWIKEKKEKFELIIH